MSLKGRSFWGRRKQPNLSNLYKLITVNRQFTEMNTLRTLPFPVTLYLLLLVLPIRFMVGPLQFTGLRAYMLILAIPLLVSAFRRPPATPDILLPLFIGWVSVCMMQNTPGQAVEHTGAMFLELAGGYFLARSFIRTEDQFLSLIKLLVLMVLLMIPLSLFETVTGVPPLVTMIHAIPGISSVEVVTIAPRLGLERVQAVFAHPIHFGLFCSTAVSLVFIGLSAQLSAVTRMAAVILISIPAFLALSSGAILSVAIQVFLICWVLVFRAVRGKWWLLVGVTLAAYVLIDAISNRTPLKVFFSYATFSAHNAYWRELIFEWGLHNIQANPIFGLGLEDWVRPHFMYSGSIDNFWLVQGMRYGVPGFALISLSWGLAIVRVARARNAASHLRRAWVFCFIGITFTLATVHVWTAVYSFVFFLLGAGQWMAASKAGSKSPELRMYRRPFAGQFRRPDVQPA